MSAPVITDRTDPRYAGALNRKCRICQAPKGIDCRSPINHQPLIGRLVHIERMEIDE